MIRKSGNRFSDKIMLKQKDEIRIIGVRAAPGCGTGTAEPTWFSLPTKISKTTPCKVAWCRWHGCFELSLRKHFDTSGKSVALFHHRAIRKCPHGPARQRPPLARQAKNPYPQLKLHRLATAKGRLEACGFCGSDRRFMTSSGKTSLNRPPAPRPRRRAVDAPLKRAFDKINTRVQNTRVQAW